MHSLQSWLDETLHWTFVNCHPPFNFVQPFPKAHCFWKKKKKKAERLLQNIILYGKAVCPGARRKKTALWKETWPLALQMTPGSEQRATVVITVRLIADRTFQQPVVNWMELRGRKLQMHRHDRCSADDLYFRVVLGHACHFSLFVCLAKVTKKRRHLCS